MNSSNTVPSVSDLPCWQAPAVAHCRGQGTRGQQRPTRERVEAAGLQERLAPFLAQQSQPSEPCARHLPQGVGAADDAGCAGGQVGRTCHVVLGRRKGLGCLRGSARVHPRLHVERLAGGATRAEDRQRSAAHPRRGRGAHGDLPCRACAPPGGPGAGSLC